LKNPVQRARGGLRTDKNLEGDFAIVGNAGHAFVCGLLAGERDGEAMFARFFNCLDTVHLFKSGKMPARIGENGIR
jgi:hypothetical protein